MGLGFAAFGAELPELEARCHERLHYARPTVPAATEDPQGTRVLNLFARDWFPRVLARHAAHRAHALRVEDAQPLHEHLGQAPGLTAEEEDGEDERLVRLALGARRDLVRREHGHTHTNTIHNVLSNASVLCGAAGARRALASA